MKKTCVLVFALVTALCGSAYAKNAYQLYNEGYDLYLVDDYKAAVRLFKEAIKKKTDFVKPYNEAGLAYVAMNQVDHALYMYKQAVYIDPKYAEAYYNAGVAYEIKYRDKNPDNDMAIASYKKAIEVNNDNYAYVRSSMNLARLYRAQQKYDDAIELLRNAMKLEPDSAQLYNESGLVYLDSNHTDYAVKFFDKALKVQQRYPEASTNLGIAYLKQGRLAKAITQFEETLEKDENFAGAQYNYGNALILEGFYEKAKAHLKKAIALNPEMAEAYYSLGKAQLHLNEFDEAMKSYKMALDKKKDYTMARQALDQAKKSSEEFRSHITFKKKVVEGEEEEGGEATETAQDESEMTAEQIAAAKKAKVAEEDVEDLRMPEDKTKTAEGEE
jgi:tetratricopeptide (TPR) repeat protein